MSSSSPQRVAAAVGRPFELATGEHFLTASIGIAVAENDDDTSASLLRDADAAMYRAKRRGPGRYELFDAALRAQVLARLRTETELRQALDQDQLRVYYQPIIEAADGRPVAVEALVRWEHPHHGLIPPLDFIPIAEETGLIIELGRHVLQRACEQAPPGSGALKYRCRSTSTSRAGRSPTRRFPQKWPRSRPAAGCLQGRSDSR